tara:strand:- start:3553 stop:4263 length:711 start_codon:yes stop_codon:yes gene_type:complete
MCDLFGLSCNKEDRATRSLPIFSEYGGSNPHGWGIGWFEKNKAIVHRAPRRADLDEHFFETIDKASSKNLISHVRWATHGEKCECNCHPFKRNQNGRDWLFAHNGWVDGAENHPLAEGDTDSESIFNEIIDNLIEYQNSDKIKGKYPAIKNAIKKIFQQYHGTINLNMFLSDGNMMYIFNHYSSKPIYMLRRSKIYGNAILISTRKLTNEYWEKIPSDRLLAINNGEIEVISDKLI